MIVIYKRIEKRMEQGNNTSQTLATNGLVYVPNNGTKGDNNGTNRYFWLVWLEKTYVLDQSDEKQEILEQEN